MSASSQPLRTVSAWQQTAAGEPSDPELLRIVDRQVHPPNSTQVLVEVKSAALNPVDYKTGEGAIASGIPLPLYQGRDFAGVVVEAGAHSGFEVGQEVFGDAVNRGASNPVGGTLSEHVLVDKHQIALKPQSLTFTEACGIPLVGMTVLDCLTKAAVPDGSRILILGASGGVGTMAVQICKARGYHVTGVCSARNKDLVVSLGADEVIDYRERDWGECLQDNKVETVFDFALSGPASGEAWGKATQVLNRGGKFITISGPDAEGRLSAWGFVMLMLLTFFRNLCSGFKYYFVLKKVESAKLQELAKLVDDGKLKPVLDETFAFTEVNDAYRRLMSGHAVGKICVTVSSVDGHARAHGELP